MSEALTGSPRVLNKLVDCAVASKSGTAFTWIYQGEGWDIIPAQGSTEEMLRWRGYLDLGGMEREPLTFFLQGANIADNNAVTGLSTGIYVIDVFSKVEITDDDLNTLTSNGYPYTPGYLSSLQDMDQVLYGQIRCYYHDAGWTLDNLQQMFFSSAWGEGVGTSASRIHLTRYVFTSGDDASLNIPESIFQCIGTAAEEADLEYIMRLRRDYELQQ